MNRLIYVLPEIPAFALAVLVCLPWFRPRHARWLGVAFGYLLLDDLVTLEAPLIAGTHWNWIGKAGSIALALFVFGLMRSQKEETALRWPKTHMEWWWTGLGILVAALFSVIVNFFLRPLASDGGNNHFRSQHARFGGRALLARPSLRLSWQSL